MNDPHVEELHYRFISENPSDRFDEALPLNVTLGMFDVELQEGSLIARPLEHYAGVESAKEDFEPHVRSWESAAFLNASRYRIRFEYTHAKVVDRNPPLDNLVLNLHSIDSIVVGEHVTITRSMPWYPSPDTGFQASSLTDELVYRLKRYRDGRDTLPVVAYYVLEALEREFQGSKGAQQVLNVTDKVWHKLSKLSNHPDPEIGRHARNRSGIERRPFSQSELQWMEDIVFRLVRRVGEVNVGTEAAKLPKIAD
jgi:hypothetical protein